MPLSLSTVEERAPKLVNLYKSAAISLEKHRLSGERASVYLVLDYSGSMRRYYTDGTAQHLAEQVLGLSAHLDDDGVVPLVFFSTDVDGTAEVSLDAHSGRVTQLAASLGHMGRTNYHWGMDAVLDHYLASGSAHPALVVFQTDGGPTSKLAAERFICKAAELPLYWQFVGFGAPGGKQFDFLRRLDDLAVPRLRPVDNTGFFPAGEDPRAVPDAVLYDRLLGGYP
ncbi:VWA domain-containing protein, partial [Streptomyces sp. TRM70308]|uniref:VWA domain-containing protein n=1 Tax=Streptomyces sp. TRM70308 TaxID=3131932 RepID=UPI003D095387